MTNEIDVIIPTNKSLSKLKKLLFQINNQVGNFKINIYIIHQCKKNVSPPGFLRDSNINYINVRIQNLSNAKNIGLKMSKSKISTFIDDDIEISKNYFIEAIKCLKKNNAEIIFFKINKLHTNIPLSRNMKNFDMDINFRNSGGCLSSSMWIQSTKQKKIFFDTNFGLGAKFGSADETDYVYQALFLNRKIKYFSKSLIFHPHEFENFKDKKKIYYKFLSYGEGQGALYKKYLKKNYIFFSYLFSKSLLKSLFGFCLYLFLLNKHNSVKYFAMLVGKFRGFINY